MPSTARQLRQPPTIEAIGRVPYFPNNALSIIKLIKKFKEHYRMQQASSTTAANSSIFATL